MVTHWTDQCENHCNQYISIEWFLRQCVISDMQSILITNRIESRGRELELSYGVQSQV